MNARIKLESDLQNRYTWAKESKMDGPRKAPGETIYGASNIEEPFGERKKERKRGGGKGEKKKERT